MSISNENYETGGTGGAIFGGPQGSAPVKQKPGQEAIGEYQPPVGLPGWKQPSFDDDDRVDPSKYNEPKSGPTKVGTTLLSRYAMLELTFATYVRTT